MTPAARAAAAIGVLDEWLAGDARAEALLRAWGRRSRYAGSKDRRAVADLVYDAIRRRRSLGWGRGPETGRALIAGLVAAAGGDLDAIFSGATYAPGPLTPEERGDGAAAPETVALDCPDWLAPSLRRAFGPGFARGMRALAERAPVDLRVNRVKATREETASRLAAEGIATEPIDLAPDGLRAATGAPVARSGAYADGWVELQDAASQAGAAFAAAQPGETVLDYCAGGGGKALALASAMGGVGRVVAHDIAPERMAPLPERAARAGVAIEIMEPAALATAAERFDLVFVDAPCSGTGTWRRDPEAKWRLTPARLAAFQAQQQAAFRDALAHVRPGGRVVYATCSVLCEENEDQADRFEREHEALTPLARRRILPLGESDGFFCASFTVG